MQLTLIRLVSMMLINAKAMSTNNTDYSCYVYKSCRANLTVGSLSCHITPLVNSSLGGIHTHMHTDVHRQKQF